MAAGVFPIPLINSLLGVVRTTAGITYMFCCCFQFLLYVVWPCYDSAEASPRRSASSLENSRRGAVRLGPGNVRVRGGPPRAWKFPGSRRTASGLEISRLEADRLRPGNVQARGRRFPATKNFQVCGGLPPGRKFPGSRRTISCLEFSRLRGGPPRAWSHSFMTHV